jgi:hypothetical protein
MALGRKAIAFLDNEAALGQVASHFAGHGPGGHAGAAPAVPRHGLERMKLPMAALLGSNPSRKIDPHGRAAAAARMTSR